MTDVYRPGFPLTLSEPAAPPPPVLGLITDVFQNSSLSSDQVVVIFDSPVDGSLLDADWLTDLDDGVTTAALFEQSSPTQCIFSCTAFFTFQAGNIWSITRDQAALVFPQSGTCS